MEKKQRLYPKEIDISDCEKEPIHIIGKSQAHGVIMSCDPTNFEKRSCRKYYPGKGHRIYPEEAYALP